MTSANSVTVELTEYDVIYIVKNGQRPVIFAVAELILYYIFLIDNTTLFDVVLG